MKWFGSTERDRSQLLKQPEYEAVEETIELDDLEVRFDCGPAGEQNTSFLSDVFGEGSYGYSVIHSTDRLNGFLKEWRNQGFMLFKDRLVAFTDLKGASVTRAKRAHKFGRIRPKL